MSKTNKIKDESIDVSIKGEWWDEFFEKDKNGNDVKIKTTDVKSNRIMSKMEQLIAGFFFNEMDETGGWGGISMHALGSGDPAWDNNIPNPDNSEEWLETEVFRKEPDEIVYNDQAGLPYSPTGTKGLTEPDNYTITNRVRIKTIFDYPDANGYWIREQAIFGGDAVVSLNTGHIFNIVRHSKWKKHDQLKVVRYIRFTININS